MIVGAFMLEDRQEVIGYSPFLRRGDLALNAVLFRCRFLGERSFTRATRHVRGVSAPTFNLFGHDAVAIAKAIYGNRSLAPSIAVNNSLFGIYLSGLSHRDHLDFISENKGPGDLLAFPKLCSTIERNRLATSYLRFCEDCVGEDIDHQGFGSWRVIHQVPFLHHCPHHARTLKEWRNPTTEQPNYLGQLPMPEDAHHPGDKSAIAIEPSDGYMGYLNLWRLLADHGLRILAIDQWSGVVTQAARHAGGLPAVTTLVEESIKKRWGLEPIQIGRELGIEKHLSVESELSLDTQPRNLARRLIVLDAMNDTQLVNTGEEDLIQRSLSFGSHDRSHCQRTDGPDPTASLLDLAIRIKIRPSIALSLMKYSTFVKAMRMSGCPSEVHGTALIRACPDELLQSISRTFQDNTENWAQRALIRRQKADSEDGQFMPVAD
jgi:hypothetical protein